MPEPSYRSWLKSLKVGDDVRVKFPWEDAVVKGGIILPGWIKSTRFKNGILFLGTEWFDAYAPNMVRDEVLPWGNTSYKQVLHPKRDLIYDPERGYVFADEPKRR